MDWNDYTSFLNKHNFKMRLKKMSNVDFVENSDGSFELHFKVKKKLYPTREEKHRQRRWNRSTRFLNCGKSQQRIDASVVVPYEMTSCFCKDCGRWVFQHCAYNCIYCGECGSHDVEITRHLMTSAVKRKCVLTKERLENKYKYNKK